MTTDSGLELLYGVWLDAIGSVYNVTRIRERRWFTLWLVRHRESDTRFRARIYRQIVGPL